MIARLSCLVCLLVACVPKGQTPESAAPTPPTLYVNGRIHTLDGGKDAQAMRVRDGVIVGLWETSPPPDAGERVVDLAGATVLPGLVDAHGHLDMLGRQMTQLDLRGAKSAEEVGALVRERAKSVPKGEWIIGFGWDQNLWPGKEFPDRAVLDAAAPGRKVWLRRISHAVWVNTPVLEQGHISKLIVDPKGGAVLHRPDGAPTGVLIDKATELVADQLPEPTLAERKDVLAKAMARAVSLGLTGVHTMSLSVADVEALHALEAENRVPIRVYAYVSDHEYAVDQLLKQPVDREGMAWVIGVKLFGDGALGSRSAAMLAPYSDDASSRGLTIYDTAKLEERAAAITRAGYQIAIHAIGDAANRQALDVLSPLVASAKLPPRIEHVQLLDKDDLGRFARNGVVASVQPIHAPSDMRWAVERVGWERLNNGAYATRALIDSGAVVVLGSDFPIESPNPWWGVHAAVTRQNDKGEPPEGFLPEQRLTLAQALEHYAVTPHTVVGSGHPGVLRQSGPADFVVVTQDPFEIAPAALRDVTVRLTVVAGQEVYRAGM